MLTLDYVKEFLRIDHSEEDGYISVLQTADKVKVSGQIFCKKPFQITRNMV